MRHYYRGPGALSSPPLPPSPVSGGNLRPRPSRGVTPAHHNDDHDDQPGLPSEVALHESAHAAACAAYGVAIDRVVVGRTTEHPELDGFVKHEIIGEAWPSAIIALAGEQSEAYFFHKEPRPQQGDRARAFICAHFLAGGVRDARDLEAAFADTCTAAGELVRQHRAAIVRLARRLDADGEVDGAECLAILGHIAAGPTRADAQRLFAEHAARIRAAYERRLRAAYERRARETGEVPRSVSPPPTPDYFRRPATIAASRGSVRVEYVSPSGLVYWRYDTSNGCWRPPWELR